MTRPLTACVARIKHSDEDIICGAGFLASPGHVMTCAHVINAALGRDELLDPSRPDARIRLDFPVAGSGEFKAQVVEWRLPQIDAAVLRLESPSPADLG